MGNKGKDKNLSPYAFTKSKNIEFLENLKSWGFKVNKFNRLLKGVNNLVRNHLEIEEIRKEFGRREDLRATRWAARKGRHPTLPLPGDLLHASDCSTILRPS